HPVEVVLKTGVKKDGTLTARQCKFIIDNGAYTDYGELLGIGVWDLFAGTYRVQNVSYEVRVVYTNTPAGGAYRGFGNPQLSFARESQMDIIAEALNMDPVELRLKNAVETGDLKASGWEIRSCGLKECVTKVAEGIGWKEKHGKKRVSGTKMRGVGIACGEHWSCWRGGYNTNIWRTGYATPEQLYKADPSSPHITVGTDGKVRWRPGFEMGPYDADPSSCVLIVNEDGTVNLHVSDVDRGQGSHTAFGIIAAEELGVPLEDVNVKGVDTDVGAYSPGTYASRATYVCGNAVRNAANQAKTTLFKFASEMLEAPPEELKAAEGRIFVKDSPERFVRIADAAFRAYATRDGGHIIVKGYYDPDSVLLNPGTGEGAVSAAWLYFAQASEVEVDVETGEVKILNVISAHDAGTVVNPIGAEGQAEGAVAQGAGYALSEELTMEEGRVLNPNFLRYIIPSTSSMPNVKTSFVDTYEPKGPFGAKGLGEPGLVAVAPSVANAVNAAVGVRICELPITPEKVLWALQSKKP
ncbi:MAG: xanthine dehydrogenase family protein molybdopterin-binding subunit, partial [Candidatus Bathyarchaeia archaeon]